MYRGLQNTFSQKNCDLMRYRHTQKDERKTAMLTRKVNIQESFKLLFSLCNIYAENRYNGKTWKICDIMHFNVYI